MKRAARLFACLALLLWTSTAFAQAQRTPAPRDGRLLVTVTDPSGAVVIDATVTLIGLENATKGRPLSPVKTSDKGLATIEGLALGRYSITAEFPGFDLGLLRDVRVRAGDNKHLVVLPLKRVEDSVTVGRDAQVSATDRALTFGTALTREQIEALSDDPAEMQRQLQEMAGPGAVIKVDSFEGQQLPPKAQIKAIHISRDQFAAENHFAEGLSIDIITQPGVGPMRAGVRLGFYDSAMDGQPPSQFARKGRAQDRNYGLNLGGTLLKNKSDFSLNISGGNSFRTPNVYLNQGSGTRAENLALRSPSNNLFISGLINYAITKDQTLRIGYSQNEFSNNNQGVGSYDLIERAYSTSDHNYSLRVQEAGPLGRRFFTSTRLAVSWSDSKSHSAVDLPTIRVNEAFTSGGAQIAGGRHTRTMMLQSDLDYVRGIHTVRTGIQLEGGRYRSDDVANYLGTYTFDSLEAFQAGRPRSYTRRIGDPNIAYWNLQAGMYVQDDIRVRKNLSLSPGVRYEAQTHLRDYNNFAPRFGFTWAPGKSGKTSLRASAGIFYNWLTSGIYEQTLRVDGFRQQEINIANPAYPDPGLTGVVAPIGRYLLGDDLVMNRNVRLSAGVSRNLTPRFTIGANYNHTRGIGVLVGENLNAPVNGVRPDARFSNVIRAVSDGHSRTHNLSVNANMNLLAPSPATSAARFNWKRMGFFINYGVSRSENDTNGAFSIPASGTLATEWGPAQGDVRHRANVSINSNALKNLNVGLNVFASSAPPITILTGHDDNGDLVYNDRPVGVGRNSARTRGQWSSSMFLSYFIGFGNRRVQGPTGIMITSIGGASPTVTTVASQATPRYRLGFSVSINNLTNHANYTGFSGSMTSPFFLQPTNVAGMRRVNLSMNLSF